MNFFVASLILFCAIAIDLLAVIAKMPLATRNNAPTLVLSQKRQVLQPP